ncbi:hypothetical protein NKJ48_11270 [Mesorhizobium sp. M0114]|uniref:hypothetical protein n=1 Tax=unclassified Mesorhizobium TaxID=325217 RepID=UPI00333B7FA6
MRSALAKFVVAGCVAAQVVLQAAQPAFAAPCGWRAKLEEEEGGKVLMASVCGGSNGGAQLTLACFGKPTLSYDLGDSGPQLEPGIASFAFKAGGKAVTKTLQLEEMYNTFTVELSSTDPLLALLRSKGEVTVASGKYGENSFPLAGSSAAIGKVLAQCGKAKASADNDN